MLRRNHMITLTGALLMAACSSSQPTLKTVEHVDLERFMGDWYVIANIPTFIEKGAHNAVESYRLDDDGTVATTFTFRKGAFDGDEKQYTPRGYVRNRQSNAEWDMQFIWPFKGDYRITYLADDYSQTVIGRDKRDYVWVMARTPGISDSDYQRLRAHVEQSGYDPNLLQKVQQQWPEN
jgi:apolipoprotein D and lipocalin family protein